MSRFFVIRKPGLLIFDCNVSLTDDVRTPGKITITPRHLTPLGTVSPVCFQTELIQIIFVVKRCIFLFYFIFQLFLTGWLNRSSSDFNVTLKLPFKKFSFSCLICVEGQAAEEDLKHHMLRKRRQEVLVILWHSHGNFLEELT